MGTFFLKTYGCQMNSSDSEIVVSILASAGYMRVEAAEDADVILINTCAIREGAEVRVWNRLAEFGRLKRAAAASRGAVVVGVLGCMAERLKTRLVEESDRIVDLVAGPDAYRDLPRLLASVRGGAASHAVNVQLSLEETYADITPVRSDPSSRSAYVSIMRGCANMCSFCVVPFTRGRERSRPAETVVAEVVALAAAGVREVTLLGQNVNSYHDGATPAEGAYEGGEYETAAGFFNMFRARGGPGVRFTELLDRVSAAAPGVRLRFTSPHPKDFPDALLALMAARDNIAKHVHLPAQSGSSRMLEAMRRGYSREAYLALAARVRAALPRAALSSDFIAGFCGESEADHADTLSLMAQVRYENAFCFAYSRRERTHAAHRLEDDVPPEVKARRLNELIAAFRSGARAALAQDVGATHLLLIEGPARKSTPEAPLLRGRTDCAKPCVVPDADVQDGLFGGAGQAAGPRVRLQPGDWLAVRIVAAGETSLVAEPIARTTLQEFYEWERRGAGGRGGEETMLS